MDITYPFSVHETISTGVLFVVALIVPAIIIFLVAMILVPGPTVPRSSSIRGKIWGRRGWEWYAGWTGLALSCVTAWLITNGMKNLFGHWRPDLLSRCDPDLANIEAHRAGGFPNTADGAYLVYASICRQTDMSMLDDGFRSFPSGHASFSAAGLIYLSLFLASKLAITIPFLAPRPYNEDASYFSAFSSRTGMNNRVHHQSESSKGDAYETAGTNQSTAPTGAPTVAARNQSAAPPLYLLVFITIPFFTAIYITSTRYSDYRHHGFDILFGFFIGTVTAYFSFRFYHLPISQGAGWAWGPRSRDHAFWAGVGVGSYATNRAEVAASGLTTGRANGDVEAGYTGSGHSTVPLQDSNMYHNNPEAAYTSDIPLGGINRNQGYSQTGFTNQPTTNPVPYPHEAGYTPVAHPVHGGQIRQ
jgi:membrane-associated phospholipid phosphatase